MVNKVVMLLSLFLLTYINITLHLDLIQSSANARSHMLVPRRGTLFPQTCVQFQTAVVLNQNLKPIFFNQYRRRVYYIQIAFVFFPDFLWFSL